MLFASRYQHTEPLATRSRLPRTLQTNADGDAMSDSESEDEDEDEAPVPTEAQARSFFDAAAAAAEESEGRSTVADLVGQRKALELHRAEAADAFHHAEALNARMLDLGEAFRMPGSEFLLQERAQRDPRLG